MPIEYPHAIKEWTTRSLWILDSYRKWLGRELIERRGTDDEQAHRLFEAPFAVLAHGNQADPILMYANRMTLELWELPLQELLRTPSRMTAEPMHRDERRRLLDRVSRDGFIDDYSGIRISGTGRRFWIRKATVWNLVDPAGEAVGQAASFANYEPLEAG